MLLSDAILLKVCWRGLAVSAARFTVPGLLFFATGTPVLTSADWWSCSVFKSVVCVLHVHLPRDSCMMSLNTTLLLSWMEISGLLFDVTLPYLSTHPSQYAQCPSRTPWPIFFFRPRWRWSPWRQCWTSWTCKFTFLEKIRWAFFGDCSGDFPGWTSPLRKLCCTGPSGTQGVSFTTAWLFPLCSSGCLRWFSYATLKPRSPWFRDLGSLTGW